MKFFIGILFAVAALWLVILNIQLAYKHKREGYGYSAIPVLPSILGIAAIWILVGTTPLMLGVVLVDFGSWILTAFLCDLFGISKKPSE